MFRVNDDVVAGIDIGGTNTELAVVSIDGVCLARQTLKTTAYATVESYADELRACISHLLESVPPPRQLRAIGIGAPNGNFYRGTIEHAPNLRWRGIIPLAEMIEARMRVPVVLTNDANAAAIGEMMYGGAKNMQHFIVITLGTGLGSGIVCEGRVLYGHSGFAGEIGHTIVDPEGRLCGCGRRGCLETYASATGLTRTVRELLARTTVASTLRSIAADRLTAADVAAAAHAADTIAREAFEQTGKILGMKLADAVAHTSPEAIFLSGGLARAGDLLLEPTRRWFDHFLLNIFRNTVHLLPSALMDNAGVLGAAALAWTALHGSLKPENELRYQ